MENKNKGEKIQIFCSKYLVLVVAILTTIIGILSIVVTAYFENATYSFTSEKTTYRFDNILVIIGLFIIALVVIFGCNKIINKIKSKWIFLAIIIISGIIQIIWVCSIKFIPYADQANVLSCAKQLLNGQYQEFSQPSSYFGIYPFQIGIIYYIALILKIFNTENFLVLQIFNVIFSLLNLLLMFKITKILFKEEKVQKILNFILIVFSIYFTFFNVHVYGNINGLTFSLIALYYTLKYLEEKKKRYLVIIAITMAISIALKSNYNIFLCGIVITLILDFLKDKKLRTIVGIIGIVIGYMLFQFILNFSLEKTINAKIPEGIPMIGYIYMGMAEPKTMSSGWYTTDSVDTFQKNNFDSEKTAEEDIEKIKERASYLLQNPKELFYYYSDKLASTWLNPTFQAIWCAYPGATMAQDQQYAQEIESKTIVKSMLSGDIYKIEEQILNIFQIIIFTFAGYAMFKLFKKGKIAHILLPMIFLGGFIFHMFWETKAIYVLQYYYLLAPYSAYGLYEFYKKLASKINKRKQLPKPEKIENN